VIDGNSTDESNEIIEKYKPWLSYSRIAPDRGQANAINLGFSICGNGLRGWINSDDFYLPGAFASLATVANQHLRDNFFYGDGFYLVEDTGQLGFESAHYVSTRYLQFGGLILTHSAFWRSSIHVALCEEMKCNIDGELWFRLIPHCKLRYLSQPLGLFRVQNESKSTNNHFQNAWAHDDTLIWSIYGAPPKRRSFRRIEYRIVQKVFHVIRFLQSKYNARKVLQFCNWPNHKRLHGDS
jgi:glycosyltransferase involved in cell wall biosynthesis